MTAGVAALGGDDPAVPKSGVVVDFVKAGVDIPELLADALDEGANVGAVAVGTAAGQEILAVHEVVEIAIGGILAWSQRELGDHTELGQRQVDGGALPEGAIDVEAQLERAKPHLGRGLLLSGARQRPLTLRDELDTSHQDREPARLVDEIDRSTRERRFLVDVDKIASGGDAAGVVAVAVFGLIG